MNVIKNALKHYQKCFKTLSKWNCFYHNAESNSTTLSMPNDNSYQLHMNRRTEDPDYRKDSYLLRLVSS